MFCAFPSVFGIALSLMSFLLLTYAIPILEKLQSHKLETMTTDDISLFVETLLLGTHSGLSTYETLRSNLDLFSGRIQDELQQLIQRHSIGMNWYASLNIFKSRLPQLQPFVMILIQSEQSGAPIAHSLMTLHSIQLRRLEMHSIQRIKSAAVRCVMPLGICFLPAFMLLTLVPIVATLVHEIF